MKKQIIYIALLIGNVFTISCQEKKDVFNHSEIKTNESQNHMDIDINEIKQQIKLQEKIESDEKEYNNPYEMTQKDFIIENQLIYNGLKQNGYKDISDEKFYEKLKLIFNIDFNNKCNRINKGNEFIVYYGNMMDGNIETLKYNQFDLYNVTNNMFFSLDRHIYLYIITLKNIIQINPDNTFKIKIPQEIISRNKYLFNDDPSQFAWLTNNDEDFMQSLVTTFGYTEDKKLLKWVMEKNYNKAGDFVKDYVFVKNCQNKLEIREDILKYIESSTNDKEYQYAKQLLNLSDRNDWKNFSDEEYFKILAYMANTFDPLSEKYSEVGMETHAKWSILGKEYYERKPEQWNQLIKEFKKNNYYGLPNLKHALKQAESYGDISIEVAQ